MNCENSSVSGNLCRHMSFQLTMTPQISDRFCACHVRCMPAPSFPPYSTFAKGLPSSRRPLKKGGVCGVRYNRVSAGSAFSGGGCRSDTPVIASEVQKYFSAPGRVEYATEVPGMFPAVKGILRMKLFNCHTINRHPSSRDVDTTRRIQL